MDGVSIMTDDAKTEAIRSTVPVCERCGNSHLCYQEGKKEGKDAALKEVVSWIDASLNLKHTTGGMSSVEVLNELKDHLRGN